MLNNIAGKDYNLRVIKIVLSSITSKFLKWRGDKELFECVIRMKERIFKKFSFPRLKYTEEQTEAK